MERQKIMMRFLAWWRRLRAEWAYAGKIGEAHAAYAMEKIDWVEWRKRLAEAEDHDPKRTDG